MTGGRFTTIVKPVFYLLAGDKYLALARYEEWRHTVSFFFCFSDLAFSKDPVAEISSEEGWGIGHR